MNEKKTSTFKPFSIPTKENKSLAAQYLDLERRLYILEGRVKELESLYYETMEEEAQCDSLSLGSQDSEEETTNPLSRKKPKYGKVLGDELK